jgi:hypothetical protein
MAQVLKKKRLLGLTANTGGGGYLLIGITVDGASLYLGGLDISSVPTSLSGRSI